MSDDSLDRALEGLVAAARQSDAWFLVAKRLHVALSSPEAAAPGERERLIARAAELTGRPPSLLARHVAVIRFVDQLVAAGTCTQEDLSRVGFAPLEQLKRIWSLDAGRGQHLLSQVVEGRMTVRDLQAQLSELRAAIGVQERRGYALAARMDMSRSVLDVIEARLEGGDLVPISGDSPRVLRLSRPLVPFADADAVLVSAPRGIIRLDGIGLFHVSTFANVKAATSDVVAMTALRSTFFTQYWTVLIEPLRKLVDQVASAIASLELENVGLGVYTAARSLELIVRPSRERPTPDRTARAVAAVRVHRVE
jgi:hypothetical protein